MQSLCNRFARAMVASNCVARLAYLAVCDLVDASIRPAWVAGPRCRQVVIMSASAVTFSCVMANFWFVVLGLEYYWVRTVDAVLTPPLLTNMRGSILSAAAGVGSVSSVDFLKEIGCLAASGAMAIVHACKAICCLSPLVANHPLCTLICMICTASSHPIFCSNI